VKATGLGKVDITVGIPTYVGDDVKQQREVARGNLAVFTGFPFFQRLFRPSGFGPEADRMEKGGGGAALSDRLLDAVCLLGPLARCREQLAAFRAAGTDLPILMPSVDVDGARALIKAFRRLNSAPLRVDGKGRAESRASRTPTTSCSVPRVEGGSDREWRETDSG